MSLGFPALALVKSNCRPPPWKELAVRSFDVTHMLDDVQVTRRERHHDGMQGGGRPRSLSPVGSSAIQ